MFASNPALPTLPEPPASRSLPFHKNLFRLTRSESTLLQLLIPLGFNSCISNAYKKPGGGSPFLAPKFYNSSLFSSRRAAHAGIPATRILSWAYFITSVHPGVGVPYPSSNTRLPRATSRYTTNVMLATTILDTHWTGRPRSIGGWGNLNSPKRFWICLCLPGCRIPCDFQGCGF